MAKKILITVIVLSAFQDKFDHKTQYPVGSELQVEKERADDLVKRGLAKVKEVAPPKDVKEPKEAKADKATAKPKVTEPAENAGSDKPEDKEQDEHQQGTKE